jgi:hypothetical protein
MRTEFNVLEKLLLTPFVDNDVLIAMENLEKKITEVEKRMVCVKNTNKDIRDTIFINQSKIEDAISYDDLEVIQRSVNDINIAIDLNDKEPIENNWYSLFAEPIKEESMEESNLIWDEGTIIEWNDTILNYSAKGGARARVVKPYTKQCEMVVVEWIDEKANGQVSGGYYSYMFKDEPIKETPPTSQCGNQDTFNKVKQVIQILKTLDNGDCVDGETMQYILEQVGMEEQMLNQLSYLFAK